MKVWQNFLGNLKLVQNIFWCTRHSKLVQNDDAYATGYNLLYRLEVVFKILHVINIRFQP